MGAWGTKIFEDDTTLDWLDDFRESGHPFSMLEEAFKNALENDDLDYDDAAAVFAAAEVVAAALGRPSAEYAEMMEGEGKPINLDALKPKITSAFIQTTLAALAKAYDPEVSELAALWSEAVDEERDDVIQSLVERLQRT